MNVQLILGNQLFDPLLHLKHLDSKKSMIFMREDRELCTHFKYHKHKIIFFLSAMRKYASELKEAGYKVHYTKLDDSKDLTFEDAFFTYIKKIGTQKIFIFEIEDKFLEKRLLSHCQKHKLEFEILRSPMFLTSRAQFKDYLASTKKPFMKNFYEQQRKRMKILIDQTGKPVGGQWSFDEDNRKPLPKNYIAPPLPKYVIDSVDQDVIDLTDQEFATHPGQSDNFWLPTDRTSARSWLKSFLKTRLDNFGPYEDAISEKFDFVNHSVLTPYLNVGLITPDEVVAETLKEAKKAKVPLNSAEGFVRQVVGWREFVRGIYQNYSETQDTSNFWKHEKKLSSLWYSGTTGIPPLDHVIKKADRLGYAHHIERLMIVGSLMLLLEIHPKEAHRWFMEMFIDSSDWVMGPNVYGMALFSDGGIFATKPYFCGSNYYRKMGGYKTGEWQDAVDGLYWGFIEKNKEFFKKNPRMSMMVKTVEKMPEDKKKKIFKAANELKERITRS